MKLKWTLRDGPRSTRDVVVTADVTATVGDIARALTSGGAASASPDSDDLTLRSEPAGRRQARVLNPQALAHESGPAGAHA